METRLAVIMIHGRVRPLCGQCGGLMSRGLGERGNVSRGRVDELKSVGGCGGDVAGGDRLRNSWRKNHWEGRQEP